MSESERTHDRALAKAERMGCTVRIPEANELFVDIDDEASMEVFWKQLALLKETYGLEHSINGEAGEPDPFYEIADPVVTESKSGLPRRHVVVTLARPVRDEGERIFIQLFLGSDRQRELYAYAGWITGEDEHPTIFFEKKDGADPQPSSGESYGKWSGY